VDPLFRQRLVGTLVLVALGIVFWPLIFVTPEPREPIVLQPMSQRPAIDQTPIPEPESYESAVAPKLPEPPKNPSTVQEAADIQTQTDAEGSALAALPDSDSVAAPQPRVAPPAEDPLVDEQGLAIFYVLQVATVGSASRANELVEGLQARGYKAFSTRYVRVDDELFRVQIGPNAERASLMRIKPEVDAVLKVDSQILRYEQ
jgi:DedD protein